MEPDFSRLFHQSSKNHGKGHPPVSENPEEWPSAWKIVEYKTYTRLPKIPLPLLPADNELYSTITARKTVRNFTPQSTISRDQLAALLQYSCGNISSMVDGKKMRRAQASAGARYPIEMYVLVLRSSDLPAGLYHYDVKGHALEVLWEKQFTNEEACELFVNEDVAKADVFFFMTAVFHRTQMKYGERGYRYILIEAGHIGQNFYLVSKALGLKCTALGGTNDANIEKLLDIDGARESVVYAVAVGK